MVTLSLGSHPDHPQEMCGRKGERCRSLKMGLEGGDAGAKKGLGDLQRQ